MRDKRHMSIRQNLHPRRLSWVLSLALPLWAGLACADTLGLPQVLEAARNNLDVSMARQAAEAARADVLAANRSPFPIFTAKTSQMDLEHGIGAGPFGQKKIDKSGGIDWTWERGNKRGLRTQSAEGQAKAAMADLQDMRVMQQLGAASAYFDLLAALERNREMQALGNSAKQLAQSAMLRLKAGDLSAQESARLEIEAQRAQADAHGAQLDQERALLQLGQFTNLRINLKDWQINADWPLLHAMLDSSTIQESWVDQRPDVLAALERVSAARAALELAQAQKKSDLTVGSSLDHYPTQSRRLLELRVSVPLQWGYGYEGEIGRAQAQLALAQDLLDKTRRDAWADFQRLLQERNAAQQREALYEQDILPRARRVAEQAELAYAQGASSLTDLLDARRTLRSTLIEAAFTRADYAKAHTAWQLRTPTFETPSTR
jgi:cobalt-zinc-cadmium efflux system outer membrane protein